MNNKNQIVNHFAAFMLAIIFWVAYIYSQDPIMLICQIIMTAVTFIIGAMKS